MTTKPKVQKYRVRRGPRTAAQSAAAQAGHQAAAAQVSEDSEAVQDRVRQLHAANTPANAAPEAANTAPLQGDAPVRQRGDR